MNKPPYEELEPELKKFLNPENSKGLMMLARGAAPLPPAVLVASWAYLTDDQNTEIAEAAHKSIEGFPANSMKTTLASKIPGWALFRLGAKLKGNEELLEVLLLNESTPNEFVVSIAASCSERIATMIANNEERVIESPAIIPELEKNKNSLKSATDRLRQFLKLAGIFVPGGDSSKEEGGAESKELTQAEIEAQEVLLDVEELSEVKRVSLSNHIANLNIGARVKLALKGNREARSLLIKDSNKTVSAAVLKSPKINENEIIHFSTLKNVADDVIRLIARNPTWVKNYAIKLNLINHPKTPLQTSIAFLKFLNLRDLNNTSKSRVVIGPVRKAARQLLLQKRK